ncbi:MAG: hypothetical protein H8E14_05615 [Candidatus Marinimicrobia bacterium]|nr:hypothetical protein [Candidatus Neomarinimicrobiota bacterium]
MLNKRITFVFCFVICLGFLMVGCEDFLKPASEEEIDPRAAIALNTVITEGPADGADLLFYSSPTIKWKGEIYPGYVAGFNWTMLKKGVDDYYDHASGTMEMIKSFPNLEEGDYTFTVAAIDDKDSVDATPATIEFTILATDVDAAAIRFTKSPTDGSYRAPGNSVFFEWTASDPSTFGSIASYSYRLDGTGASATSWSSANLSVTSAAITDLQLGVYSFEVKAVDNSGTAAVSSIDFEVKAPSVLVVDDYVPATTSAFLDEIATDNIVATILRDWAWAEWDVSEVGATPTLAELAGYTTIIWYVDGGPYSFYYYAGGSVENPLDDFLDGGGNLWLIGDEILYFTEAADTAAFDAGHFMRDYMHLAGGGDASSEFTGLVSLGVTGFTEIGLPGLATGTGWPDEFVPATDAGVTAVYDLGGAAAGTTTGVLFESATYNTLFWGVPFAFEATNHNHLTLAPDDMYPVVNHVLGTVFGE